ncbi:MAG: nucleotidyltransferase domain-containing protein [Spirochaetes bacterium]|jgi:predicted nucleotidyltransferase|nr:nucleotidyltransferase domain-containing protein [Spirochaetota bacterium]
MIDFQSRLDLLISRIVEITHPLRIVMFGSAARRDIGPDSDVDLLVIMPEGTQRRATAQKLYKEISGVGIPFDVLVATPSDILKHKDNIGLIYRSALREGREVYAA